MTKKNSHSQLYNLTTELDELYKTLSEIRTLLWSSKKLNLHETQGVVDEQKHLALQVSLTTKQIKDYIDTRIEEFYSLKMTPGSLVVMTTYFGSPHDYGIAKKTPRLESGDIFLYLGLSEQGVPRWLINDKVHKVLIPPSSFKVLSKNVKEIANKLIVPENAVSPKEE